MANRWEINKVHTLCWNFPCRFLGMWKTAKNSHFSIFLFLNNSETETGWWWIVEQGETTTELHWTNNWQRNPQPKQKPSSENDLGQKIYDRDELLLSGIMEKSEHPSIEYAGASAFFVAIRRAALEPLWFKNNGFCSEHNRIGYPKRGLEERNKETSKWKNWNSEITSRRSKMILMYPDQGEMWYIYSKL